MQRGLKGGVGDLEVAAARELLEFHQCEIRFNAGGIAIHQQADGAGRGDHADLGVSVTELLTQGIGVVPGRDGTVLEP